MPFRGRRQLTDQEVCYLQMQSPAEFCRQVSFGKIRFRTESSQLGLKHDDSIVKTWYHDENNEQRVRVCYGIIQEICKHQMYPGGPTQIMLKCEWLEEIDVPEEEDRTKLPRVRRNPDSNFNRYSQFTALAQCAGYNIMLARHNPWSDPASEEYNQFDVIDRWRLYENHCQGL